MPYWGRCRPPGSRRLPGRREIAHPVGVEQEAEAREPSCSCSESIAVRRLGCRNHARGSDFAAPALPRRTFPSTNKLGFAGFRLLFHTTGCAISRLPGSLLLPDVDDRPPIAGSRSRGLASIAAQHAERIPTRRLLPGAAARTPAAHDLGLLDSPSVAGAYSVLIDASSRSPWISTRPVPRSQIERLGIAPGTSMFLVGKNDRRVDKRLRPEIHDSTVCRSVMARECSGVPW